MNESPGCLANLEPGNWIFNQEKGFTSVSKEEEGPFKAIQPCMAEPQDEVLLMKMRKGLEDYTLNFLIGNNDRAKVAKVLEGHRSDAARAASLTVEGKSFEEFWKMLDPNGEVDIGKIMDLAAK